MKLKINYKKNKHQKEFDDDLTSKFLHLSSGFGGGKSYALVMKALKLSWLNKPWPGGIMAPTFRDLKRDIIPIFEDILDKNRIQYYFHKTDYYYKFPWTDGKLFLFSGDTKLRGPNLAYFLFNEATLLTAERYREGIGRVRIKGTRHPQIASVGTPEGIANYMYDLFVDKPMPNSRIIYGDTRDNIDNLDPGYIVSMEHSFDKIMLDAYLKGLWIDMNGNRFYYSYDPSRNDDKTIVEDKNKQVHCFLDFNVQHMTATLWHYDGTIKGFGEVVLENNADTVKMCDALKARGYTPDRTIIYPDPAGNARSTKGKPDNEILRMQGFNQIRVKSVQPRFRTRQLNTNNLLDKGTVTFNPDTMRSLKKDLQAVQQDPITLEKDKSNPKLTHASDGFDYGCDILFPFSGVKPESAIIKFR